MAKSLQQTPSAENHPDRDWIQARLKDAAESILPWHAAERVWMRLTQAERDSLGGDLQTAWRQLGTAAGMLMRARGYTRVRATIDAAYLYGCLDQSTYEYLVTATAPTGRVVDDEIERVAAECRFVVAEHPRRVYWDGRLVEIDWAKQEKPWQLLVRLALAGKRGGPLQLDEFSDKVIRDGNYFSKLVHRISELPGFPPSLADVIQSAGGGALTLRLEPHQIRHFMVVTNYVLQESSATTPMRLA